MNPDLASQVTVGALLLSLTAVTVIGFIITMAIVRHVTFKKRSKQAPATSAAPAEVVSIAENTLVGSPVWMAVKCGNPIAVQSTLGLRNSKVCTWVEGIASLGDQSLFISPPIDGWLLIVGPGLPDPFEDIDACFRLMLKLSRELGHVQFFALNSAVSYHAWARMEGERVIRAYAWAGETLWNQGKLSMAEAELGMKCLDYGENADFLPCEGHLANAEKVMALAARWSLDPMNLNERRLVASQGIAGELQQFKRH